jgi:hypothetical protein
LKPGFKNLESRISNLESGIALQPLIESDTFALWTPPP